MKNIDPELELLSQACLEAGNAVSIIMLLGWDRKAPEVKQSVQIARKNVALITEAINRIEAIIEK